MYKTIPQRVCFLVPGQPSACIAGAPGHDKSVYVCIEQINYGSIEMGYVTISKNLSGSILYVLRRN